ncbi:MAG: hypothetical protein V1752_02260 [Candidatus Firestonebacteria bacterium]
MRVKAVFLFLLLYSAGVYACRPLTTDDCGTVEKSKFELETGYEACGVFIDSARQHSLGVSFKHGVTESMDIGMSFIYQVEPAADERLNAATLALKFAILKDLLSVSLSNTLGAGAFSINSILSRDFSVVNAHLNIGYNSSGDPNVKGSLTYGITVRYPVENIEISGESFGDEFIKNWLFGARYELFKGYFIDAGYGRSFNNDNDRITVGFHYEF